MAARHAGTNHRWESKSGVTAPVALDTLKLTHNEWIAVVEQIKRINQSAGKPNSRRQHARAEALGLLQFVIDIKQPGGTDLRLIARSHDLSAKGLGFIHGRYLHPESKCVCWMRHAEDGLTPISGAIRWCRHIAGVVHMSGVQLDEAIDIAKYMPCPSDEESAA